MSHNVLVNLLARSIGEGLDVLGSGAKTAVKVDLVGLQCRENQVGANGSVLVGLENGEDGGQNKLDEVIKKALVILVQFDGHLSRVVGGAMRKVEEIDIKGLFRERLTALLLKLLRPLSRKRPGREDGAGRWRWLIRAEGCNVRLSQCGHVIDKHLSLGLDVNLIRRVVAKDKVRWQLGVISSKIRSVDRAVEVKGGGVLRVDGGGSRSVQRIRKCGRSWERV